MRMRITTGRAGALRVLLQVGLWTALAAGAAAQATGPLPERRAAPEIGVDLYGGDLRDLRDVTLGDCARACLGDPACGAFTWNGRVGACFLKSAPDRAVPYSGAISARLPETPAEAQALAARRAAEAAFLPAFLHEAARRRAEGLATGLALGEGPLPQAALRAATTDGAEDWLALARLARAALSGKGRVPEALIGLDAEAALNAHLRAADPETAAQALAVLAQALEADGRGDLAVPALRLAERLAPAPDRAAALARVRGLYGFRVVGHAVESDSARPRVCAEFSEPLSPAADYAPYVRRDGPALPVEAEGRRLCLDGLSHGEQVRLTLREGLPAASGERLARSVDLDLYIRDRAPSVRFPGRATVLPAGAGGAIPLAAVNVSDVELQLHRIGDRNLLPAVRAGLYGRGLDDWARQRIAGEMGEALWTGTATVETRRNEEVTSLLPLSEALAGAAPGVYALSARLPGAQPWEDAATQWFTVTDLGLSTVAGSHGLTATVRGLSDAAPRAGATVRLIAANNEVLGEAATDAEGRVRFDPGLMRGTGGRAPALVTVEHDGGDFAFLDLREAALDLSDRGVAGRPAPGPVDVFLALDRGAYRPGETVHATVLARDARAEALAGLPLTAVVTRPDGVEHARLLLPDAGAGGRALTLPVDRMARRGGWRVAIHADPEAAPLAVAGFLVEDFEPERLDLTLTAPEGPADPAGPLPVSLETRFLHGAPGAGATIEAETRVTAVRSLPDHEGWVWGLEDEPVASDLATLPPGASADAEGRAELLLPLPPIPSTTRPLMAEAAVRVADASGRPVERRLSRVLAPETPILGLRPLFGDSAPEGGTAAAEVRALGPALTPVATGPVQWTLSRLTTDYQWSSLGGDWRWEPIVTRTRVAAGEVALTADAPARIEAPVDWGRYELRLTLLGPAPAAASLTFAAGWHAPEGAAEAPDRLAVGLDRTTYAVGDTARLRVEALEPGALEVQILSDRVIETRRLTVDAPGDATLDLPVTEAWRPGAYVAATLIRPMDAPEGRNPARAMGLAHAAVDPGPRRLAAAFETPAETRPRRTLEAVLRVDGLAPGETAWATVSAVDLGILNLTAHAAPDPAGHYLGRRRLGVELRDLYGRIIDGLTGARGTVRSGGDGGLASRDAPVPTQELVAVFSGPVRIGPDGTVTTPVPLPAFNGTVRLSAVVWSDRGVGSATTDVLVRDPVTVAVAAPRFLAPGDASRLRVELTRVEGPVGEATVEATASGALALDGAPRPVVLPETGRVAVDLPVRAVREGDAAVELTVTTPGGERLASTHRLPVRATDPETARTARLTLAPGGTLRLDADAFAGFRPGAGRATLAVGPGAGLDTPALLAALDAYPWGCTEQLASRALPLLYLSDAAAAMGLAAPADLRERIDTALRGMLANQDAGGSFGLWRPEGGDFWLDAYATDVLTRARDRGHAVPDLPLRLALDGLRNRLNYAGDFEEGGEAVAYALMVLAREGAPVLGDLRYYADARAGAFATPMALAQLGAGLAFLGDRPRAEAMFALAAARLGAGDDEGWRVDFGSALRDAAAVLALAAEAGVETVDRAALARRLAETPRPASERSPQENAWTLLAAHALGAPSAALRVDGAPVPGPVLRLAHPGDAAVTVENAGDAPVPAVLTVTGQPEETPGAEGRGYRIERAWFTPEGVPVAPETVALGQRLVAVVTVTPERTAEARLMVTDPLPAGFEIDNPNLIAAGQVSALSWLGIEDVARHAEFRADRFLAAVDWRGDRPFRLAYRLRATAPGTFRHPAASVEDMYRPQFRARSATGEVTVAP